MKPILWINPEMGCILKSTMHESFIHVFVHRCFFIFVHFWLGVLCKVFSCLLDRFLLCRCLLPPYVIFADGASCSTQNLSSAAWVIYDPVGEFIDLQGICLGRNTNNVVEYSVVIELLTEAITLNIRALIVNLDS